MRRRFPVRHGDTAFHLSKKLLVNSFLFDVGLVCFNSIGNCSRMVSYRHGADVIHLSRKLFANSFLSGVGPMCAISTGNCLNGDFSTPLRFARNDSGTWRRCESYRWETVCGRFPVRRGVTAFHLSKKLLVNSFLSGMGALCFNSIGNYLRMVSCSAWGHCVSIQ